MHKRTIILISSVLAACVAAIALLWLIGSGLSASAAPISNAPLAELRVCPSGCNYTSVQAAVDAAGHGDVITRLHSVCLTGDVFGSLRCDCGVQLQESMKLIAEAGEGIVVYNPTHEGRGTGLIDKLAAYRLQEQGFDTAEANEQIGHPVDSRHYGVDAQILHDLKVSSVRLLTNNPEKIAQLRMFGVDVGERIPLWVGENPYNSFYLQTKETKLGHIGSTP